MTRHKALLDAPLRAVSATLTEREPFGGTGVLAPGDEISLAHHRFLVEDVDLAWLALVGGARLTIGLATTPDGVLVTAETSAPVPLRGIVDTMAARAAAKAGGEVIVGAAIVRDGAVLAQQRAYPPSAAGKWELPGGRVEDGESDRDALVRECVEELGVPVVVGETVGPDVALPGDRVLRVHRAALATSAPQPHPHDHQALRWLTPDQFGQVSWLPADRVLLPALGRLLGRPLG